MQYGASPLLAKRLNMTSSQAPSDSKGPLKYYVIMFFFIFLGPPTHLFDDLQYIL